MAKKINTDLDVDGKILSASWQGQIIQPQFLNVTGAAINGLYIAPNKGLNVYKNLNFDGVDGKTLTINQNLTLDGTDGKTLILYKSLSLDGEDNKKLSIYNTLSLAGTDNSTLNILSSGSLNLGGNSLTLNKTLIFDGVSNKTLGVYKNINLDGVDGKTLGINNNINFYSNYEGANFTFPNISNDTVVTKDATQIITNKAITKRVYTFTSPTPSISFYSANFDGININSLNTALTINNPLDTGTDFSTIINKN